MVNPNISAWAEQKVHESLLEAGFESIRLPPGSSRLSEIEGAKLIRCWGPAAQEVRNRADGIAWVSGELIDFFWEAKECAWEEKEHYNLALEAIQFGNYRKRKNCLYCIAYKSKSLVSCQWAHKIEEFKGNKIYLPDHKGRSEIDNKWVIKQLKELFPGLTIKMEIFKKGRSNDPFLLIDREIIETTWLRPDQILKILNSGYADAVLESNEDKNIESSYDIDPENSIEQRLTTKDQCQLFETPEKG